MYFPKKVMQRRVADIGWTGTHVHFHWVDQSLQLVWRHHQSFYKNIHVVSTLTVKDVTCFTIKINKSNSVLKDKISRGRRREKCKHYVCHPDTWNKSLAHQPQMLKGLKKVSPSFSDNKRVPYRWKIQGCHDKLPEQLGIRAGSSNSKLDTGMK